MQQSAKKRNLVICRAGDGSLHPQWLQPRENREFELFIDYYGNEIGKYAQAADYYRASKSYKWPQMYNLIASMPDKLFEYDAIWFPDDDLSTDCTRINKMFEIFHCAALRLAQPALTRDSYYSHAITLENSKYAVRFTNFVEVMAPIFSREALMLCWQTFKCSSLGWGIDFVWPKLLAYDKVAIIDETPVWHTRPVGGGDIYKLIAEDPHKVEHEIAKRYGIKLPYAFLGSGGLIKTAEGRYEYCEYQEIWYDYRPHLVLLQAGKYREFIATVFEDNLLQYVKKLYYYVGFAWERLEEYSAAIDCFEKARQHLAEFDDKLKSLLCYHMAFCLEKINEDGSNIQHNNHWSSQLNPHHEMAIFREGKYRQFIADVLEDNLVKYNKKYYFHLGSAYEKLAEYSQAVEYFEKARQYLDDFDAETSSSLYYHSAYCLEKINGDPNLIRQNYLSCIKLNPGHKMAKLNLLPAC